MNCIAFIKLFFVLSIAETAMLSQYQSLLNVNWPFKNFITVWTFLGRSYDSDKCFQFYKCKIGNICLLLCNQRISELTKISILLQHTASRLQCIWWKNIANCVFLEISSGCKINKKKTSFKITNTGWTSWNKNPGWSDLNYVDFQSCSLDLLECHSLKLPACAIE